MLNFQQKYNHVFMISLFLHIDMTQVFENLPHGSMAADGLATQGARASANHDIDLIKPE